MQQDEPKKKKQTNKIPKNTNNGNTEQLEEGEPKKKKQTNKIPKTTNNENTEQLEEGEVKMKKQAKPKKSNAEATELIKKRKNKMEIKPVDQIQCKIGPM